MSTTILSDAFCCNFNIKCRSVSAFFAVFRYAGFRRLPYASLRFVAFFRIKERKASIKVSIGKLVFLWLIIFWLFVIIDW